MAVKWLGVSASEVQQKSIEALDAGAAVVLVSKDPGWLGHAVDGLWEDERGRVAGFVGDAATEVDRSAALAFAQEQFHQLDSLVLFVDSNAM